MTGLPAGMKAEVNFGGTWTDVTAYTAGSAVQIHYGRTSEFSDAAVATLSGLRLNNDDGRFTPKCQLLADGVTANPYYPNVLPRALVRLSYTISGTTYYRFYGYVQGWPPLIENLTKPYTMISAVDRGGLLEGVTLTWNAAIQSALTDSPLALIPFNDPTNSTSWAEIVGQRNAVVSQQNPASTVPVYTSGADSPVPFADGFTGLSITSTPTAGTAGWATPLIPTPTIANTAWTLEGWITFTADPTTTDFPLGTLNISSESFTSFATILAAPTSFTPGTLVIQPEYTAPTLGVYGPPSVSVTDSLPHHYAMTGFDDGTTYTVSFYFDGALVGSAHPPTGSGVFGTDGFVTLSGSGGSDFSGVSPPTTFGPACFYAATMTPTQIALHYAGGTGGHGYTTGQRITEYLRWYGVAVGDQNIAAGLETVGQHPVAGQTILKICQDMASTEGGGAVFYHDANGGKSTFLDRHFRSTTTPLFTVDAEADLDGSQYAPSFDALTITNQSTLMREGGATVAYTNQASVAQYGLATDSANSQVYCATDQAALNIAQDRVASSSTPAFRVGRLTIDLLTAMTSGLYQLVGVMFIGSRLRATNLLAALHAPVNQVDIYSEGWTESITADTYSIAIDTSPADNPPRGVVSTMKAAPVAGNMSLSATITAAATTILIANSDGFFMTTTSASYPIYIQIGEEVIELAGVPGGSSSPQTFTACVRGAKNTRASAQTAGAVVSLWSGYGKVQL